MPCYKPLIGVDRGYGPDGKRDFKVLPHGAVSSEGILNNCKYFEIPCGHCIGCRESQSREWSNRLLMESLYHKDNYFVTLTLCPEYAIMVPSLDLDTGEYCDRQTLDKKDIQDFIKRLRKKFDKSKIRYYFVGEYGPKSGMAHYHGILFCDFAEGQGFDLIPSGTSETGQQYFESKILDDLWSLTDQRSERHGFLHGKNYEAIKKGKSGDLLGWTSIEPANYYTMRYVSQYIQKKLGAYPNMMYELENRIPPFALSSRNPGIGYQYFYDHPEVMNDDKIQIGQPQGVVEFMPPRYFRKKLVNVDPGLADDISDRHVLASSSRFQAAMSCTDLDSDDYKEVQQYNRLTRNGLRDKI